jgi:hypothetical protein
MKTCKLEIKTDLKGEEVFVAYIDSVIIHPTGEKIISKLDEVLTKDAGVAVEFLVDKGVERDEVLYALNHMEENGHDIAHFGMMGGFVFSKFNGKVQ